MRYSVKLSNVWSDDSLFVEDDAFPVGFPPPITPAGFDNYRTFAEMYVWRRCHDKLVGYLGLTEDWDGDGAEAPSAALIQSALELLAETQNVGWNPPSRILPTSTGAILFEWQTPNQYIEAEVVRPGYVEWMEQDHEEQHHHWTSAWRSLDSEEADDGESDGKLSNRDLQRPRGSFVSGGREVA